MRSVQYEPEVQQGLLLRRADREALALPYYFPPLSFFAFLSDTDLSYGYSGISP